MEVAILGGFAALGIVLAVAVIAARRAALTERATANELRKQVRFSADVFDSLPIGLAMRDLEGRYVFVNRAWERFVGARREEVIGRTVYERTSKQEADAVMAEDRAALARGPGSPTELKDFAYKGRHFMLTRTVITDALGARVGVLVASVDTSERAAVEQALRNQVKFTNDLVDSLPVALSMRDPKGKYLFVNRTWEKVFGDTREHAVGQTLHQRIPQALADEVAAADREALDAGPGRILRRELELRGMHLVQSRAMMADEQGKPLGVLSASVDETERRRIERALADEQRRFELVVRAANVGIVDWDGVKRTAWYSPRFKDILRYPPDADTAGWPDYFDLVHPEDRERVRNAFRDHIFGRTSGGIHELHSPIEYRLKRADDTWVWIEAVGASVRDSRGYATRFIASIEDISERRFQEEQLRSAVRLREQVERMSRHDLKTPLSSVIAMTRLLRDGGRVAVEDHELLTAIERAGYRILSMVNLSLDLFRMEQGTYEFRPQPLDIARLARRVAADLESQAASKGVRVQVSSKSAATACYGEEILCYSMLANLIKNAIEAAPDGGTASVTIEARGEELFTHVHNAGAVPETVRARFFQKYTTEGKSGGIGLGAYSARLMARVQQGNIKLRTSHEDGTTLSVRLNLAPQPEPPADASLPSSRNQVLPRPLAARRVLIVDDDEFNRLVLRRSLPSPPFECETAVNGRAALDAARRAWPEVVLLDLEMPVMDGYEAAAVLRGLEREGARPRLTIVAISSNDDHAVVQRALDAGCDHYIVKPAPREALLRILQGEVIGVDPDLHAMLPQFLESRRRLLDEMPEALAGGDRARFRRIAHQLAGSFVMYGFGWAAEQCRGLQNDAAAGEPAELARRAAAVRAHLDTVTIK